jgi:hypothetical protein
MTMKLFSALAITASLMVAPIAAQAQTPGDIDDLIGARGSSYEGVMKSRGYAFVKKEGEAQYWWNVLDKTCVAATIANGRVDTLNTQPASACGQGRAPAPGYTTRVKQSPAVATASEQAVCKLTNTAADRTLFDGDCSVTQKPGYAGSTIFEVHMGQGQAFLFAGKRGDPNWMHGAEKVHFTDLPNGAIFHWGTFALVVRED